MNLYARLTRQNFQNSDLYLSINPINKISEISFYKSNIAHVKLPSPTDSNRAGNPFYLIKIFVNKTFKRLPTHYKHKKLANSVLFISIIFNIFIASLGQIAKAQQHSYDPNTDNDSGQELADCGPDIAKYCKFWSPLLFELENCLQSHMETLRPACRAHLQTTDFRRYHTGQDPSSGF